MASSTLLGRRILVVEDEYLIAVLLRDHLLAVRSTVIGPVPSVSEALRLVASHSTIDIAILDVNLGGVMAYPVADVLTTRNIPFVFASRYEERDLRDRYPEVRNCPKPYLFPQMRELLESVLPH
jgi:CheY-like chemotaxis protein